LENRTGRQLDKYHEHGKRTDPTRLFNSVHGICHDSGSQRTKKRKMKHSIYSNRYSKNVQLSECKALWLFQRIDPLPLLRAIRRLLPTFARTAEFDFAIRNAVFQYLAFIQILKQFNLINPMEEDQLDDLEEITLDAAPEEQILPDYQQKIEDYFVRMDYKPEHKALFYLGRVLNTVAQTQYKKEHKNKAGS
jgi:hypothetical protein